MGLGGKWKTSRLTVWGGRWRGKAGRPLEVSRCFSTTALSVELQTSVASELPVVLGRVWGGDLLPKIIERRLIPFTPAGDAMERVGFCRCLKSFHSCVSWQIVAPGLQAVIY